jgi:C4-dicarboxylate-specific signal transduction histidine kinase
VSSFDEERFNRGGIAFFGKLAASVTHELNNAFSIIDQAGGLLGDLSAASTAGRPLDPARLETVRERIDRQVRKGVEIVNRLNRFAHSIDEKAGRFDVAVETENFVALTRRFAELDKVRLQWVPVAEELLAEGDAFALQQALFGCLSVALGHAGEGDRIEVRPGRDGGSVSVRILGPRRVPPPEVESGMEEVEWLMKSLGGSCGVRSAEEGGVEFELRLPAVAGPGK